jgi:hypothetical protein
MKWNCTKLKVDWKVEFIFKNSTVKIYVRFQQNMVILHGWKWMRIEMQKLVRDRFTTQLCLLIWSGVTQVLLACPQLTSFWPSLPAPWVISCFCLHSGVTNLSLYKNIDDMKPRGTSCTKRPFFLPTTQFEQISDKNAPTLWRNQMILYRN